MTTPVTRVLRLDDAADLAALVRDNREFLAPWEPVREEPYFTHAGQQAVIAEVLRQRELGMTEPRVILDGDRVVGRITIHFIARGPFQSCGLGYWVSADVNGRGLASAAVGEMVRFAFAELGLHRVEAGTLLHNHRSQRVLERNGFTRFGVAPRYLNIAGQYQDHALYQVLADSH